MFGLILNRMIFGELLRVFVLALIALTGMFLLAGLVAEATQRGLAPSQIAIVIPLLVPNTLPFTIPATTLFATCIVYGRLAADNEVTAIKSAGVHLGRVIAPGALLGLLAAGGTMALYWDFIPRTHLMLRSQVLGDVEEILYGVLRRQGSIRHPQLKCSMWVKEVRGRRLLDVIFKQHDGKGGYSQVARAREAELHIDPANNQLQVFMPYCVCFGESGETVTTFRDKTFPIELPKNVFGVEYKARPGDLTWQQLLDRRGEMEEEVRKADDLARDPPPPPKDYAPSLQKQWFDYYRFEARARVRERASIEAELHQRPALSVGCLCFVLLGGPVGIWFSKSDYLSAFVTCFLPTVFVYYPLLLCGTNLAKDGRVPVAVGIWAANGVAGLAAVIMYWRLFRR